MRTWSALLAGMSAVAALLIGAGSGPAERQEPAPGQERAINVAQSVRAGPAS